MLPAAGKCSSGDSGPQQCLARGHRFDLSFIQKDPKLLTMIITDGKLVQLLYLASALVYSPTLQERMMVSVPVTGSVFHGPEACCKRELMTDASCLIHSSNLSTPDPGNLSLLYRVLKTQLCTCCMQISI